MVTAAPQVFVSYARRDFYFAEQLAVALQRHDVAAWFDVHQLPSGTDWSAAIDRAIGECDGLVLVSSQAALASPNVRAEYRQAMQRGRPVSAVRCGRITRPNQLRLPTYDLRCSFESGVTALAEDLVAGRLQGRVPRVRLPLAVGALLVAAAPAVSLLFAVTLSMSFLQVVLGHVVAAGRTAALALMGALTLLVPATGVSAYTLVAFLRRTISWRYLRGALVTMPLLAVVGAVTVGAFANILTTDPIVTALGGADDEPLGAAPTVLALLVMFTCLVAALATEFSAGLCRFLRTGAAPRRIRARHVRLVSPPPSGRTAVRACRILAAEMDAGVAKQLRRCLADTGIVQVTDCNLSDRDVVVVSDATPAAWLSRRDLRDPIAVVATSISHPLRGVLGRFQWVDHRQRRGTTLRLLAGALATGATPVMHRGQLLADVPERLELPRLPVWVAVTEWMLFCLGIIAAQTGTFAVTQLALEGWTDAPWLPCLCLVMSPLPFLLARRLRRRQLTLASLVGAVAVFWAALILLGMNGVLQQEYPSSDRGDYSTATIIYPAMSALLLAGAARSLLGWLPKRLPGPVPAGAPLVPTLGSVFGTWAWLALLLPALMTSIGTALLNT